MATIKIKDLVANVDLDRQAMATIVGGARIGSGLAVPAQALEPASRVFDYPPGFPSARQPVVDERIPPQSILRK